MFHKNRKLAALEPRHLLPVWLLEMYWERPRNLFFHYARCWWRCQRCLLLLVLPSSCWTCCCRCCCYASDLALTSAVAAVMATATAATSAIRLRLLATNVCVRLLFVSNMCATKLKICCTSNRTSCAAYWGSSGTSREFVERQRCCCYVVMLRIIVVRHLIRLWANYDCATN